MSVLMNFTVPIMNQKPEDFIQSFEKTLYDSEEELLDVYEVFIVQRFSKNKDYHSKTYNTKFNDIIFSNVCEAVDEFDNPSYKCPEFSNGILQKGMYSSTIKYNVIYLQILG